VGADSIGGESGGERLVGEIVGCLGGMMKATAGIAGEDVALDPDDGPDVMIPVGVGKSVGGIEDSDDAAFDAIAPFALAAGGIERRGCGADIARLIEQSGLIVLELDDQGEVRGAGDLEQFF
jgi:hypothetical protein